MKWIKRILISLVMIIGIVGLTLYILLSPSGKVSDFQAWQPANITSEYALTARFFGVSTLLFDDGKDQILIDGFFSRPSLWQVLTSKLASDHTLLNRLINHYQLDRTRAVLVTHSHYDHALDLAALSQLLPNVKVVGSPSSLHITRANTSIQASQLIPVIPFQTQQYGRFNIIAIPSAHTPPTAVNDDLGEELTKPLELPAKFSAFKEGGSYDYFIEHQGQRILIKASTGYVPNQYQGLQVDTLFLGIAQLSRQSAEYQAAYLKETLENLQPKVVIPIHWDNFFQPLDQPLVFLPRLADHVPASLKRLIDAAKQQDTEVILLTSPVAYPLTSQALESNLR